MKIGILSDIHANHYALQEVLAEAKKNGVEKLLIAGDFVGYYYQPQIVMELLNTWELIAVRGNHETYLEESISDSEYLNKITSTYGNGIAEALNKLTIKEISFLFNLPKSLTVNLDGTSFHIFHGSPSDENQYLYPDVKPEILDNLFKGLDSDIFIGGHTHHSCFIQVGTKLYINPGSVGQSRTNGGIAFWGIYNTSNNSYTPKMTSYDTAELLKEVAQVNPQNKYLAEILKR